MVSTVFLPSMWRLCQSTKESWVIFQELLAGWIPSGARRVSMIQGSDDGYKRYEVHQLRHHSLLELLNKKANIGNKHCSVLRHLTRRSVSVGSNGHAGTRNGEQKNGVKCAPNLFCPVGEILNPYVKTSGGYQLLYFSEI
jgi:hypothetical protein